MTRELCVRAALVAAVATSACAPYEIEDRRRLVLQSWADNVLFPAYAETTDELAALSAEAAVLCAMPSAPALASTQAAWSRARGPWKRTEVFAFGPYKEEPLRFGPKIDAWPERPDVVAAALADSFPLDEDRVDALGVFATGFPALEVLLFDDDIDPIAELGAVPRRCEYISALVDKLARDVGGLDEAWQPRGGNYLAELTLAGRESTSHPSLADALGEVVNRMGFTVENIAVDKLGGPLGDPAGETSHPELAESPRSGRSIDDIRDNLRGVEALFFADDDRPALETILVARGFHHGRAMTDALVAARQALDAIDGPLTGAIGDDRAAVIDAIERLRDLQRLLQGDVLDALSLELDFNDSDGD